MLLDVYYYVCGKPKKPPGYYARFKYLVTVSRFELIEASLPVFIAAGISGSATGIIEVICEDKSEDLEVILTLIYALTMYIVGKVLTFHLLKDEANNSKGTIMTTLRKYKIEKLLRHSLMELSGFAWKEFFILLCLKEIYLLDGYGSAVGAWLMIIALAVVFIRISSIIQRRLLRFDNLFNQKLLSFDTASFSLSIGYILAVLLCLGAYEIGIGFVPDSNVIFEWNEDFEDDSPATMFVGAGPTFLFTFMVLMVVAAAQVDDQMPEEITDEICVPVPEPVEVTEARMSIAQPRFDHAERVTSTTSATSGLSGTSTGGARHVSGSFSGSPRFVTGSFSAYPGQNTRNPMNHAAFELENVALSTPSASTVTATRSNHPYFECLLDPDSSANCVYMWNEFLGYFAGVTFYILVLVICSFDFRYKIVPALLVALIVTYNAPHYLAKLRITSEETTAKRQDTAQSGAAVTDSSSGANSGAVSSNNTNPNFASANTTATGDNTNTRDKPQVVHWWQWWVLCTCLYDGSLCKSSTTNADDEPKSGCCAACGRWYASVCEYYGEMSLKRKGVMMVAVRLTVGWVWETVLVYLYDLFKGGSDLEPYQTVLVEVSFAAVIVGIVLGVHLFVRDWADEGTAQETERLNVAVREIRDSGAAVEAEA